MAPASGQCSTRPNVSGSSRGVKSGGVGLAQHLRALAREPAADVAVAMPVLVLSPDPVAAALLGAFVESLGRQALFGRADEPHRELLRRVRPRLVLLDCALDRELCDSVLGPAKMMGARVILFAPEELAEMLRDVAQRRGVEGLILPRDLNELAAIVTHATEADSRQAL